MNKRRKVVLGLSVGAFAGSAAFGTQAQQPGTLPRIGYLSINPLSSNPARIDAFKRGLRELGYVEGKNITIEWRSAEGKSDRAPTVAAELVKLNVELIVTAGAQATRSVKAATSTIPIVMASENDPVGSGFVASLARPGGNITGLARLAPAISGKQLEILRDAIPNLSRVAVLGTSTNPGTGSAIRELERAAKVLGLALQYLDVRDPNDIAVAFQAASEKRAEALLVLGSYVLSPQRKEVVRLAAHHKLPGMYERPEFVEAGGLMTFSVSSTELFRRAATYVDKILKGRKPADLPVEQPTRFELIVNLKTAKALGITIPPVVMVRATRVIQ